MRENWPNPLRKGMCGLQMESVICKDWDDEFANNKVKYSGTFHWDRMLQPFRQRLRQYWTV